MFVPVRLAVAPDGAAVFFAAKDVLFTGVKAESGGDGPIAEAGLVEFTLLPARALALANACSKDTLVLRDGVLTIDRLPDCFVGRGGLTEFAVCFVVDCPAETGTGCGRLVNVSAIPLIIKPGPEPLIGDVSDSVLSLGEVMVTPFVDAARPRIDVSDLPFFADAPSLSY